MPTLAEVLRQTGYSQDGRLAAPASTEPTMTSILQKHIASLPQKFNENQAAQMDLLARAYPGNTFKSNMLEGDPKAMAELAMQAPIVGMVAYHGTPHKILGKFDINKVGTGEGAQAYGHGMYFAENPNVAETYKHAGEIVKYTPTLQKFTNGPNYFIDDAGNYMKVRDYVKNDVPVKVPKEEYLQKFQEVKSQFNTQKPGNLYKVDIPDEHIPMMLDYDKPIKDQPALYELVRKSIKDPDILKTFEHNAEKGITGANVYKNYIGGKTDAQRSENALNMGIKGISYLDEASRGLQTGIGHHAPKYTAYDPSFGGHDFNSLKEAEEFIKSNPSFQLVKPTSNFVVFEPSTVEILEENAKPVSRKALIEEQVKKLKD